MVHRGKMNQKEGARRRTGPGLFADQINMGTTVAQVEPCRCPNSARLSWRSCRLDQQFNPPAKLRRAEMQGQATSWLNALATGRLFAPFDLRRIVVI